MGNKIQSVRGMSDLLPPESNWWHEAESSIRDVADLYGYQEIRLPLLERTELFKRSIGEQTDIVEKEMYTFPDNRGESLTLRPEATASCVRACIERGIIPRNKVRLWYMGPMFRYERPQKGRYRQFHQFGIEAFGWDTPDIDAEIILFAHTLWQHLGMDQCTQLEINSIGTSEARKKYRATLVSYFEKHKSSLDQDSQRRLLSNPLRILDSKVPEMQELISEAPVMADYLDATSRLRFERLCEILESQGIGFSVNHRLVRGLDYYTDTVFEWTTDLLGAQNAICGGGRYDGLAELLGGSQTPGAGFALGMERLIEVMKQGEGKFSGYAPHVYICTLGEQAQIEGFTVAKELRAANIQSIIHCGGGKLSKQLNAGDRANSLLSVIIGADEIASSTVVLKSFRAGFDQKTVARRDVIETIEKILDSTTVI